MAEKLKVGQVYRDNDPRTHVGHDTRDGKVLSIDWLRGRVTLEWSGSTKGKRVTTILIKRLIEHSGRQTGYTLIKDVD